MIATAGINSWILQNLGYGPNHWSTILALHRDEAAFAGVNPDTTYSIGAVSCFRSIKYSNLIIWVSKFEISLRILRSTLPQRMPGPTIGVKMF